MLKKALLLLVSTSLFAADESKNCSCNDQAWRELSTTEKVVIYSTLGVGAIMAAPLVLPASAIAAATSAATFAATCIIPTTVVAKVSTGLSAALILRPYVFETTEERRDNLLKEKSLKPSKAKAEFISCLKKNKATSEKNASGRPTVCEEAALFYALTAGNSALDQKTEAFNNGQCFCS